MQIFWHLLTWKCHPLEKHAMQWLKIINSQTAYDFSLCIYQYLFCHVRDLPKITHLVGSGLAIALRLIFFCMYSIACFLCIMCQYLFEREHVFTECRCLCLFFFFLVL